jgi:hypothetical protein
MVYVAVSIGAAAACDRSAAGAFPSLAASTAEIDRSVHAVNSVLNAREYAPACGKQMPAKSPAAVIAVTAGTCLSCRNIGYLVRSLKTLEMNHDVSVAIVMPVSDTAYVCQHLKRERVDAPSLAIDAEALPDPKITRDGIFVVRRRGSVVHSQRIDLNVLELETDSLVYRER